ncbi:DUF2971 domain-containing protein [Sphingomonas tabacisoli]|uniref:DUF2971 domain-containing protein n=1 Tax=Sphingomonas tabacisoli TaxID=2249466 RepID=A0ABW4I0F9_9SPHN
MDQEALDATMARFARSFMPFAHEAQERVEREHVRFVHYTSAESGLKILQSGRMLLRNATLMNDFSEIEYGMRCLDASYAGPDGLRLQAMMKEVQTDLPSIFQNNFSSFANDLRHETYLTSISEHEIGHEDEFGRLSMWRAYAQRNGIAFVMNNTPFVSPTNALQAYTSPVMYASPAEFATAFKDVVNRVEGIFSELRTFGGQWFHNLVEHAFRVAVLSTKHPSFMEEREWRIIYTPTILQRAGDLDERQLERIPTEIMCLNGVPQRVYAIPFRDYPDEGFNGATIPAIVDRILIGPTQDAYAIAQAFVAELTRLEVPDAEKKVLITGIPLRQ